MITAIRSLQRRLDLLFHDMLIDLETIFTRRPWVPTAIGSFISLPRVQVSNLDSGKVSQYTFQRFELVRTILLGVGSQGASEDRSKGLIPHP